MSLNVCDACMDKTTVDDLLSDEGWATLVAAIASIGKVEPERKLTQLAWEPIGRFEERAEQIKDNPDARGIELPDPGKRVN